MSQSRGGEALGRFMAWKETKSLSYFREIANRERTHLARTVIMQECQIDRSAIRQNSGIATSLMELEDWLRVEGVLLAPDVGAAHVSEPQPLPMREKNQQKNLLIAEQLNKLEKIVAAQKAELDDLRPLEIENEKLRKKLAESRERMNHYAAIDSVLNETGRLAR